MRIAKPGSPRLLIAALCILSGLLILACGGGDAPEGAVHVSKHSGAIGPVTADFIDRSLDKAEDNLAAAWVLQLDTPGGLVSATDEIVQRIESATVPVIVYVSPLGARAASAGTFITMAAHIAAMAPSTQIGAAHPVAGGGQDIEGDLRDKVENDAAADIRAIAQLRGRNADWAERAVRESISASASEAVELNVVDRVAGSLDELLAAIDGQEVELQPGQPPITLRTADAPRVNTGMTLFEEILSIIADPNIAFLLLNIGGLLVLVEVLTPGLGPGIFGVILLIVGFFAVGPLDTNPAGIALLVIAFVLFAAEILNPGFGVFGIGGILALVFSGLFLVSDTPNADKVSLWVLAGVTAFVALVMAGFFALLITDRRKARRPANAEERVVGKEGVVRRALAPRGLVLLESGLWSAQAAAGAIPEGTRVRVVGVDGLRITVEPAPTEAQRAEAGIPHPQKGTQDDATREAT